MMKSIVILLFTVCTTSFCQEEGVKKTPCIMYKCSSDIVEPVCGKQEKNGCVEERIFQNECYMLSANSCGKGLACWYHSKDIASTPPCGQISCLEIYDAMCGKQKHDGCWEDKVFLNTCHMTRANSSEITNYVPCVENKCPKPSEAY